jgi:gliding-associated putative ABC transporter substrate-binding component GldG
MAKMTITQKTKYGMSYLTVTLIIFAILAVVNFISTRRFLRVDLTENKLYTVCQATRRRLKKLDDLINIKVYFSKKLPPYLLPLQRQVKDILAEYRAYSHGKVQIEYVDPTEDQELQRKLRIMGIPQVQLNIRERDKIQVMNAYLGIGVFFEDKKEVIPVVKDTSTLEYDLTRAIIKVSSEEEKKVAFFLSPDTHKVTEDYERVKKELEGQYRVSTIELETTNQIPDDIDTLIVAGPKDLKEEDKFEIDQFLMKKGRVIFLIDSVVYPKKFLWTTTQKHNLGDLLNHYGVRVNADLVLDRSNEMASFSSGFFSYSVSYPFWPKILSKNMDKTCPIVSKLETLFFPWVSSIEVIEEKCKDKKVVELFKTTEFAWNQTGQFNLDPQNQALIFGQLKEGKQQYLLGVYLTGQFKSFYADRPAPQKEGEEKKEVVKESKKNAQIIVVGDSDFLANQHLSQNNLLFFLNAVDFLTLGEDLIEIRSREATDRPLKELSEKGKNFYKYANVIGMPCLLIVVGFIRSFLKRKEKKMYADLVSEK